MWRRLTSSWDATWPRRKEGHVSFIVVDVDDDAPPFGSFLFDFGVGGFSVDAPILILVLWWCCAISQIRRRLILTASIEDWDARQRWHLIRQL